MSIAADLLGLCPHQGRRTISITCPVCAKGREKKLNINFEKNVFRCAKCGVHGGVLDFWALYRGTGADLRKAAKDYYSLAGTLPCPQKPRICPKTPECDLAGITVRNEAYTALTANLGLSEAHRKNLLARGLSDSEIERRGYRSYPVKERKRIASDLERKGYDLKGIPGFYMSGGGMDMLPLSSGILIPQRDGVLGPDGLGRIRGFQVRLDKGKTRYVSFSTGGNYPQGTKGKAYLHVSFGEKGYEKVIFTEGPLKGDIISYFTGYTVIALQGVNSQLEVPSVLLKLKERGCRLIYTAFDMDLEKNVYVRSALKELERKIEEAEIARSRLIWDPEYKGLDDWLNAKYNGS